MIDFLSNPICILCLILLALAVILPWLKRQARKTDTVVDDKIITLLQVWLSNAAGRIMGMKKLFLLVVCVLMLQGCVFSGYGVNYETGNYLAIAAQNGEKNFNMVASVKDSEAGTLDQIAEKITVLFKAWME